MATIKGLNKVINTLTNPLFTIPVGDNAPEKLNMLVEIPKGTYNKYEYVVNTGTIMLDRVLYEQIPYPIEYGLIPQTWDDDDDMLDIMALLTTPTFPGCLLRVRPIGVMIFCDSEVTDDKILAVAADDIRFNNIKDIKDLDPHKLDEIAFFFQYYKSLQFKYKKQYNMKVEFKGWKNREKAMEIVNKSMNLFKVKFPETQK